MADDLFEPDESQSELLEAWQRGARGVTRGTRRLSGPSMAAVAAAVERWENQPLHHVIVTVTGSALGGWRIRREYVDGEKIAWHAWRPS